MNVLLADFQGIMRLEVVEAKDLKKADTKVFGKGGKSDPYCKVIGEF